MIRIRTSEFFKDRTVLSFEVFPPKRTYPIETVYDALDELKDLKPDFISVTYGAGGSDNCQATLEIASNIKKKYGIESVAHLPCINLTENDVIDMIRRFKDAGIENILALRGDITPDFEPKGVFKHASELISYIKKHAEFNIIGACYPEGHTECESLDKDIENLKNKVDCGCNELITQLFFDNNFFYSFMEKIRASGIKVPVSAGIMPVVNKKQIERMVTLCGVSLPKKFIKMMEHYENKPEAMRDAGIAYAVDQIVDLLSQGVDGIHLYTMNNSYMAEKIYDAVSSLIR